VLLDSAEMLEAQAKHIDDISVTVTLGEQRNIDRAKALAKILRRSSNGKTVY